MAHKAKEPYITPELLHRLLKEFSMLYNKENKETLNIYVVGGSALQLKYGVELRDVTFDGDAYWVSNKNTDITKYINEVSEKFKIPDDWLNSDFRNTKSFSKHIINDANIINTYGQVNIYVVSDITQLCMKITSERTKDIIDSLELAGKLRKTGITEQDVYSKIKQLYNGTMYINPDSLEIVIDIINGNMTDKTALRIKNNLRKQIATEAKKKADNKKEHEKINLWNKLRLKQ